MSNTRKRKRVFSMTRKKNYCQTAKELHYPDECIDRIMQAQSENEALSIMATYRSKEARRHCGKSKSLTR